MKNISIRKSNNQFYIKLNFLGGIETFTDNEEEIEDAIEEAILGFIEASKKFGKGIYKELKDIEL